MIQMHSLMEHFRFGLFCLYLILAILMVYLLVYMFNTYISMVRYRKALNKAKKELNKILRQLKKEDELSYIEQFELIINTLKEGNEK